MLKRENSEFQWYKQRTAAIHTRLKPEHPVAIPESTMDSEPANPEDRAQQDLPPKSYADAAHEAVNGDNDYKHSNGHSTPNKEAVRNLDENKIVYEKYKDGEGSVLVSVKPDPSYEESLKHNKATAPRSRGSSTSENKKLQDAPKPQLQAGRRAGAGWERSAYVFDRELRKSMLTESQHSLVPSQCTLAASTTDSCSPMAHRFHRPFPVAFLPSIVHPSLLADPPTIPNLYSYLL